MSTSTKNKPQSELSNEQVGAMVRKVAAAEPTRRWEDLYRDEPNVIPSFHEGSFAMHNAINCCALFSTESCCERKDVKMHIESTNGFVISYRGPALHQDDKAVLLGLIKLRRGLYSGSKVSFAAYAFIKSIGWSQNAYNKKHLDECLERLKGSTLKMTRGAKEGLVTSFVLEYGYKDGEYFVTISDSLANLFAFMPQLITYVNADTRRALTDGLQTWLFDYISSNDCQRVLTYSLLAKASGRAEQDPKEFAKMVKAALPKLQSVGAIADWSLAVDAATKGAGVFVTK